VALENAEWLYKIDGRFANECMKTKEAQPFCSVEVLTVIKKNGGVKHSIKYFEYLVNERKVMDCKIHTELACMYIQCIKVLLNKIRSGFDQEEREDFMDDESLSPPASINEGILQNLIKISK
jgi:hypothetical protein